MTTGAKVLVTGGAGFIGSHLVEHLLATGHAVVVLDNFRNGKWENLPARGQAPRLEVLVGDITDRATCARAMAGVATVYHLACLGVRHSLHAPVENHQVNAFGTLNLLEAARQAGKPRFLYMSTSEIYGRAAEFPLRETSTPWPLTIYGASKLAGEHYTRAYHEFHGLPTVCVRTFNNYGPRSHFEGDAGEVIPRFILRALHRAPPQIYGDGSVSRDFLHVTDCARTLPRIAACASLSGEVVNLGYGEETRIGDLARQVLATLGITDLPPVFLPPRPADVPRLWVDVAKLRSHLSFQPRLDLRAGLLDTCAWFRQLDAAEPNLLAQIRETNWEAVP